MTWPSASRCRRIASTAGVAIPCVSPCARRSISAMRGGRAFAAARCGKPRYPLRLALRALQRFQRRRRRAEHDRNAEPLRAHDRQVARGVAEAFLLLERAVVLLVDDDQARPRERAEHSGARADDDAGAALAGTAPRRQPFAVAQVRVQHRQRRVEARAKACDQLRRERDLGHEHQRLLAARDDGGDRAQIDLGLAAAGHAIQQMRREAAERAADPLHGLALRIVQRRADSRTTASSARCVGARFVCVT